MDAVAKPCMAIEEESGMNDRYFKEFIVYSCEIVGLLYCTRRTVVCLKEEMGGN